MQSCSANAWVDWESLPNDIQIRGQWLPILRNSGFEGQQYSVQCAHLTSDICNPSMNYRETQLRYDVVDRQPTAPQKELHRQCITPQLLGLHW